MYNTPWYILQPDVRYVFLTNHDYGFKVAAAVSLQEPIYESIRNIIKFALDIIICFVMT
jgi:hypothetical protein